MSGSATLCQGPQPSSFSPAEALEGSQRAGQIAAQEVTYKAQQFVIPGSQSFETRVGELQAGGSGRRTAIDMAWEETNLNLPRVSLPGEKLDFTLNAQWVLEAGFDPLDLVLPAASLGSFKGAQDAPRSPPQGWGTAPDGWGSVLGQVQQGGVTERPQGKQTWRSSEGRRGDLVFQTTS